jgi:hypothetical protein
MQGQQQQHQSSHQQHLHTESNGSGSGGPMLPAVSTASTTAQPSSNTTNHFSGAYSSSSNGPVAGSKPASFSPLSTTGLQQLTTKKLKVSSVLNI